MELLVGLLLGRLLRQDLYGHRCYRAAIVSMALSRALSSIASSRTRPILLLSSFLWDGNG